jgi:hypothetical protein
VLYARSDRVKSVDFHPTEPHVIAYVPLHLFLSQLGILGSLEDLVFFGIRAASLVKAVGALLFGDNYD